MGKYQKNIEAARRISVMQYLETYHPGELVRKTDKEYCTKTHSSLVITPANGLFHWFSQSKGGNNALDYLVKVEGMDFVSAVRLLNEMTPMPVSVQTVKAAPVQQQTSRPFVLPPADRNTEAATAYLMHRGVSPKVLRYCVGSGILYQTTRGSYRNCVFVGKDENGVPRSAFQRGCQGSFRGDVAGSQKQYGFLIPAESENCDTVEIYEAPIDAMSGATLRQYKHDSPWRSVHYLALGGLNHQPIDYFLQQHPEVKRVSLMANTCPQTKEQKMQRQKARSEIANAKPKGKRQVKASQGNTSYGKMVKQDKPFVKKQNTHTEQKPTAK